MVLLRNIMTLIVVKFWSKPYRGSQIRVIDTLGQELALIGVTHYSILFGPHNICKFVTKCVSGICVS